MFNHQDLEITTRRLYLNNGFFDREEVIVRHKPTGIIVKSSEVRSIHKNKAICLEKLAVELSKKGTQNE